MRSFEALLSFMSHRDLHSYKLKRKPAALLHTIECNYTVNNRADAKKYVPASCSRVVTLVFFQHVTVYVHICTCDEQP